MVAREPAAEDAAQPVVTLPPGQHRVEGFPRFGTHLHLPPPEVPAAPAIEVAGAVTEPFAVPLADLAGLPRREITADLHCVAGWSATGLRWEGVALETFYRELIEPTLQPDAVVSPVVFGGLDGYRVSASIEDALGVHVLIAEHLNGLPLDGNHGAPARRVRPNQYGFVSAKHLCRIEVHTSEPKDDFGGPLFSRLFLKAFHRHPRARVWEEERHRYLPTPAARLLGRVARVATRRLSARASRR